MSWHRLTFLASVGLLFAACSNPTMPVSEELTIQVVLDQDPRQQNRLLNDQEIVFQELVGECIRQEGFEYFPLDDTAEAAAAADAYAADAELGWFNRNTGLVSIGFAEREGFGISRQFEQNTGPSFVRPKNLNVDYLETLQPEEEEAYGRALGRCEQLAQTEVGFDEVYELLDEAEEIELEVNERILASSDFARLVSDWASCYADSGAWSNRAPESPLDIYGQTAEYVYEAVDDVEALVPVSIGEIRTIEIEAALASARCADDLSYADTFDGLFEQYLSEALDDRDR